MKYITLSLLFSVLLLCSCRRGKAVEAQSSEVTAEMALEGVDRYCHEAYDWSAADENPEIMSVAMGDGTATEHKVVFRSYTGAFVYFFVDKASGKTRMVEYVPALGREDAAGTIDIHDYLGAETE